MSNLFSSFNINASGMTAQRYRMDTISENVANANTTRTEKGEPYRRKGVIFAARETGNTSFSHVLGAASRNYVGEGVKVTGVYQDRKTELKKVYNPSHPDADEDGYVLYPNVNIVTEMTNMIDASRAYEANATAFTASKAMAVKGLELGR